MAQRHLTSWRWSPAIILLHWVMAVALCAMLLAGFAMTRAAHLAEATGDFSLTVFGLSLFDAYQLHKSLGFILFLTVITRGVMRLHSGAPSFPADMSALERVAARSVQVALYGLMLGVPITGWLLASSSTLGLPTIVFGLFELPHPLGPDAAREAFLGTLHWAGAWAVIGLAGLHIAAALKHHLVDRDDVLRAMLPRFTNLNRRSSHHVD
ncbi:cytochrome b [Cognatiyoonia sp. IB215446]|uniref:cytochrome b n=1 Tax=Cognatiyoonia sp. IB215446 TaxID=3097355 RepID=UPI002A0D7900|nr:cytochrome b [Cognatiyoonia sp. IB215446]MDX8350656.1 cytochrome b [Cognatiyoonia sp. IB215446]